MSESEVIPEIKEILGAMLFATREPLSVRQMVNVFRRAAQNYEGVATTFAEITAKEVEEALEELREDLRENHLGLEIAEIADGYRLRNRKTAGPWLRELLEKGKPNKLSKPALETLSIIAYRQPIQRSGIESIRGVAVDSIVRTLLEMGLVKVVGRSELPGKPWLYGTTQVFLEHFGLKNLDDLPGMAEMRRNLERQQELDLEVANAAEAQAAESADPESENVEAKDSPEPQEAPPDTDDDSDERD
ncbi:MAG: SMC-Scp complex subunit ScpB [Verrucomicrobia bacterium]|nr:SMC-Scp complex subunit ScpB [Verrucomicrobiota bacterium]MCH8511576.1 SMC-Scp complex subunit ScpB [Kiritimatiellia bacterium]